MGGAPIPPMRILTVGNMYPPHHQGGYEAIWQGAVRHLRRAGHEVRVLTTDHREPGAGDEVDAGVHRELRWYWRDHDFPRLGRRERFRLERANAAVFDRHLADFAPDVVGWWAMGGMSLSLIERARRAGLAAHAVVCDAWTVYAPEVDGWTRMFAGRPGAARVAEWAGGIPARVDLAALGPFLFLSRALFDEARERWPGLEGEVGHRGPDRDLFPAAPPAAEWGWRLLYVGRVDPRKGIDTAIAALAELGPEATLAVYGRGDPGHREELRALAARLGVAERVEFAEAPRDRLASVYAGADALVFPVAWPEPWGLVPLEAMSVGRPVVATGTGGSGEYLRDGENCLRFDPAEGPSALAAALRRLAAEPGLRERLRAGGLETVERLERRPFDVEVERLCARALSSPGSSRRG
ncbi:MAG TPA: glycosyltransferase [Solirubrobacterales bacterium]